MQSGDRGFACRLFYNVLQPFDGPSITHRRLSKQAVYIERRGLYLRARRAGVPVGLYLMSIGLQ